MAEDRTIFQNLVDGMMNAFDESGLLEDCMSFDLDLVEKVPLRYRLIALAFVRGDDLETLNASLKWEGLAELYSRSFWEAGLIYAFSHHMSYRNWQALEEACRGMREEIESPGDPLGNTQITLSALRNYVGTNSFASEQLLYTRHLTRDLERRILESESEEDFRQFLAENIRSFTAVREKTRYYFCKYLLHFLDGRVHAYQEALRKGLEIDAALEGLSVLKGLTALKRKKMTPEEAGAYLEECAVSPGEIFDAFNYYYFEYVSLDWLDVQLEYYGNLDELPEHSRRKLAGALRYHNKAFRKLSDEAVLEAEKELLEKRERELDTAYSLDEGGRGYQKNRSGENAVRKFLKGALDPDRTTLISFLLFFGSEVPLPKEMAVTKERLSNILIECGYPGLRPADSFDSFVIRYLEAKDPSVFLMEEVTRQAMDEENSYLFRMYRSAGSYEQDWLKLMGLQG